MSGKLNRHVTVWRPNLSGWDPAWGGPNCKICLDSEPAVRPIVRGPLRGGMIPLPPPNLEVRPQSGWNHWYERFK